MNSVAAVHHSTAPPLMTQSSMDNKVRPPPIAPVIQNTNQVLFVHIFLNYNNLIITYALYF